MKILARHLTADLFNCQNNQLTDKELILDMLKTILQDLQMQLVSCVTESPDGEHEVFILALDKGYHPARLSSAQICGFGCLPLSGGCRAG